VVFSGLTFLLLFLPLLLALYFVSRSMRWRNGILVLFSLIFYAWGEPVMVLLLIGSTLVNYLCAHAMERATSAALKKLWLGIGVAVSLAGLFYFKYAGFFVSNVCSILSVPMTFSAPRLPIGISFYTFQILTYTIDVYRKKVPLQKSFWKLLLYVSCFPQLIAGPIVQYGDVYGALDGRTVSSADFTDGMRRFFVGLGKKVLIANTCGSFLLAVLPEGTAPRSVSAAWLSGLLFSLQLYFDFSAYSDMAIGLGRVLGFTYKENFRYPYCASSPSDFWRRWHISLGSFFRDYVYIPLGGSRRGKLRRVLNLLIVWSLTGLWHGAAWNFVLWGVFWFLLLLAEKALSRVLERIPKPILWFVTFSLWLISLAIFYHTDLSAAWTHLGALFGIGANGWIDDTTVKVLKQYALYLPIAFAASMPIVPALKAFSKKHEKLGRLASPLATACSVALALVSLLFLIGQSYNPFIYFRF
jgi:alginate O-acetyltransferase complex protein AlgI